MRIYPESREEAVRAHKLLKDWASEGLLSKEQYHRLEQETVSDLRVTNIYLRVVLFFFTVIGVAAAVALFFTVFVSRPQEQTTGIFLLVFAAVFYTAAELAVALARLYRFGVEEALAASSVALLCAGLGLYFFGGNSPSVHQSQLVIPAVGVLASLWIWYRFHSWYAFPAAMIFAVFLPGYWTASPWAQHVLLGVLYAAGLLCVARIRSRHRFDLFENGYSLAEAFLWLGIYLTLNLKISDGGLPLPWLRAGQPASDFAGPFYWTTWVLIWCLPPLMLARGVGLKDRLILGVGGLAGVLTLVTNKPYLGWQRHTWDPMFLGVALAAVALLLRRWLARGAGGVRHGFTAKRLSGKDKQVMSVGAAVLGLRTAESMAPAPQPAESEFGFGGGESGGGGAGGDF